jgi:hypothetical protein
MASLFDYLPWLMASSAFRLSLSSKFCGAKNFGPSDAVFTMRLNPYHDNFIAPLFSKDYRRFRLHNEQYYKESTRKSLTGFFRKA